MTQKGYMNDFYKQFERLNSNFEKANQTISKMSFELSCVRQELKEAIDLNKKLVNLEVWKAQQFTLLLKAVFQHTRKMV